MLMNPPLPATPSAENGLIDEHVMHQMDTTHQQLIEEDEISIFDGPANQPVDHSKPLDYYKLDRLLDIPKFLKSLLIQTNLNCDWALFAAVLWVRIWILSSVSDPGYLYNLFNYKKKYKY